MLYVRRYKPILWDNKCCLDAVSLSDLVTDDNDISVWEMQDDQSDFEDIVLAMAMSKDKLVDFYMLIMDDKKIKQLGLSMNPKPSSTKYVLQQGKHNNIYVPTFWEIGYLAEYMYDLTLDQSKVFYVSEPDLKEYFYKAVKSCKIDKNIVLSDSQFKKYKQPLLEMEKLYGSI